MIIISLQRAKCIGCNYCEELAPNQFRMSKKDGKAVLLKASNKKGFYTLKTTNELLYSNCAKAANACPVNIISVKQI